MVITHSDPFCLRQCSPRLREQWRSTWCAPRSVPHQTAGLYTGGAPNQLFFLTMKEVKYDMNGNMKWQEERKMKRVGWNWGNENPEKTLKNPNIAYLGDTETYARFLESWDLSGSYWFVTADNPITLRAVALNVADNWSRWPASTNTPPDASSVTGFFNA